LCLCLYLSMGPSWAPTLLGGLKGLNRALTSPHPFFSPPNVCVTKTDGVATAAAAAAAARCDATLPLVLPLLPTPPPFVALSTFPALLGVSRLGCCCCCFLGAGGGGGWEGKDCALWARPAKGLCITRAAAAAHIFVCVLYMCVDVCLFVCV